MMFRGKFQPSLDTKKGFQSTAEDILPMKDDAKFKGGPVDVDHNAVKFGDSDASVADCIWGELRPILNKSNEYMEK